MIFVDDFLTRRYWDRKPYPFGLGTNIELNYITMPVEDELRALKQLKAAGVDFCVFMVGYVLDMALGCSPKMGYGGSSAAELKRAVDWLVENDIQICGHGYFHTEPEYLNGYHRVAHRVKAILESLGQTVLWWRFPREQMVNEFYIASLGFEVPKVHGYLDNQLLLRKDIRFLRNYGRGNYVVHSLYITKVVKGET